MKALKPKDIVIEKRTGELFVVYQVLPNDSHGGVFTVEQEKKDNKKTIDLFEAYEHELTKIGKL